MAERDSWAVMDGSTRKVDAEDARLAMGALWTPGATLVSARAGVRPGPGDPFKVAATGTPGANVTVQLGQMVIPTTRGFGSYTATLDATKTLAILDVPADPTNQRNDLVIAKQTDTYYSDGSTVYLVQRVQGTASATPADPSLATFPDCMLLARVRVTAAATTITNAMIDDLRPGLTVAVGGILPVNNVTERGAIVGFDGMAIYRRDKDWVEVYDGTAWRVQGLPVAAALADITHPVNGQMAILSTDMVLYRYTGSAWIAVANYNATGGLVKYKRNVSAGTVASGTPVKLGFGASVNVSTTDVAVTGAGNTDFEVLRPGTWRLEANVPWVTAGSGTHGYWAYIADSTNQATRFAIDNKGPINGQLVVKPSDTKRLAANTKVSVYAFQDSGAGRDVTNTEYDCDITLTFLGP